MSVEVGVNVLLAEFDGVEVPVEVRVAVGEKLDDGVIEGVDVIDGVLDAVGTEAKSAGILGLDVVLGVSAFDGLKRGGLSSSGPLKGSLLLLGEGVILGVGDCEGRTSCNLSTHSSNIVSNTDPIASRLPTKHNSFTQV